MRTKFSEDFSDAVYPRFPLGRICDLCDTYLLLPPHVSNPYQLLSELESAKLC